jgi:hypothetical protein
VPRDNVIIRLCSIECNFALPLTDDSNKAFQDDIVAWSKLSQRLYIWDYITNFAAYVMPFPNWCGCVGGFGGSGGRGVGGRGSEVATSSNSASLRSRRNVLAANVRFFQQNGVKGIFE